MSTKKIPAVESDLVPAVYQDANRHTCICLMLGTEVVEFVPLEGDACEVQHLDRSRFLLAYAKMAGYPVKRAAQLYLHDAALKTTSDEAREHLERIVANPAYNYDVSQFKPLPKEKKVSDPISNAADAAVKKSSTKKTPAKAPVKAAAKAPVKAAAKKTAAKAPAKTPAKKIAAKAPAKKANEPDTTVYKVVDDSSVKRGFLREYVDVAIELKKFQRDELVTKLAKKDTPERLLRYFYYCTGHGIFA